MLKYSIRQFILSLFGCVEWCFGYVILFFVYSIPKVKKQTFSKLIMYESVATNTTPFVAPIYLSIFLKETKKNFFTES